jgi:hypothetical protein
VVVVADPVRLRHRWFVAMLPLALGTAGGAAADRRQQEAARR